MRKSDRSQINEINVVPYVDVMLVLLVVFMVTAPLLVQGIKIDLPETTASVLEESESEELTLTIDKKGQFFIEFESYKNKSFSIDTLKPVLEDIFKINNNLNVYIRGDKDVEYDNVLKLLADNPQGSVVIQADEAASADAIIQVMDGARDAGVFDISLAAEPD